MGTTQNSNYTAEQKREILQRAGKLPVEQTKKIEDYSAFDHHEMNHAFNEHAMSVMGKVPKAEAEKPVYQNGEDPAPPAVTETIRRPQGKKSKR